MLKQSEVASKALVYLLPHYQSLLLDLQVEVASVPQALLRVEQTLEVVEVQY
jgi:hypothetical protein